jgi:hypothetical protein
LAEWIGENMQEELGFPDKADKRAQPGSSWTPAELNRILDEHVVSGELITFGCVELQSRLFRGTMRARCYPFDMQKKLFLGFNLKVCEYTLDLRYVSVHTSIYTDVLYSHTQDTVVIVPPYPYCIEEDSHDVALEDCWFARPQLFLSAVCVLRMEECRRTVHTKPVQVCTSIYLYIIVCTCLTILPQMISFLTLFSSTP